MDVRRNPRRKATIGKAAYFKKQCKIHRFELSYLVLKAVNENKVFAHGSKQKGTSREKAFKKRFWVAKVKQKKHKKDQGGKTPYLV